MCRHFCQFGTVVAKPFVFPGSPKYSFIDFALPSEAQTAASNSNQMISGAPVQVDLGKYFPDTDDQWKGVSSLVLLEETEKLVAKRGYKITNIDTTIVAQQPKLSPYIQAMTNNIAEYLKIHSDQVNIKATTTENLGFTGREEGISAYAVVLLQTK